LSGIADVPNLDGWRSACSVVREEQVIPVYRDVVDVVKPALRRSDARNQFWMGWVGQVHDVDAASHVIGKIPDAVADLGVFYVR
jgi:hypothetical protein